MHTEAPGCRPAPRDGCLESSSRDNNTAQVELGMGRMSEPAFQHFARSLFTLLVIVALLAVAAHVIIERKLERSLSAFSFKRFVPTCISWAQPAPPHLAFLLFHRLLLLRLLLVRLLLVEEYVQVAAVLPWAGAHTCPLSSST